jgi:hypothetical protein
MLAAGAPLRAALLGALQLEGHLLFFRRVPQLAAREPLHRRIGMPGLQLLERRQQLFLRVGAEGGWLSLENDRPVDVTWRHNRIPDP